MNTADDVILRREGALGHITLNRPAALNALTHEMCAAILNQLQDWARDPDISAVLIDAVCPVAIYPCRIPGRLVREPKTPAVDAQ